MEFVVLHKKIFCILEETQLLKKHGDFKKIRGGNHKIIQGLS